MLGSLACVVGWLCWLITSWLLCGLRGCSQWVVFCLMVSGVACLCH